VAQLPKNLTAEQRKAIMKLLQKKKKGATKNATKKR
jgi:hypothetical protein